MQEKTIAVVQKVFIKISCSTPYARVLTQLQLYCHSVPIEDDSYLLFWSEI